MSNFIPHVWAPALTEQLQKNLIMWAPDTAPEDRKPRPPYTPVSEGSYLAAVIEDELYSFVPDSEHEEAAQVMIDALNAWISERAGNR